MKVLLLLTFLSLISCTATQKVPLRDKSLVMDSLWDEQAKKKDVISMLGSDFKEVKDGIIYLFPNSNYPESGHFFNKSLILEEQFLFLEETDFEEFKKQIKCEWKVQREVDSSTHAIRTLEKGNCKDRNIFYVFPSGPNAYEVRWKK